MLGYAPKPQSNIGFNYRGNTIQPTIQQLQPLRDNTDVLNEYIGNPNLKVGFSHSLNLFLNSFKVLSGMWKSLNFSYNVQQNAITQFNTVDITTGKRTYYPINVNGNRSWFLWSNISKNGGNKKPNINCGISGGGQRFLNFVNGQRAVTNSFNVSLRSGIGFSKEEKYDFSVNPEVTYNSSKSSISTSVNSNYWSYGGNVDASFLGPWKLEFENECEFDLRQRLKAFPTNNNVILWNTSIKKWVMKKKGAISLVARDLLNQNKGFTRNISSTFISDDKFQRVGRYFLLKFEWNFTKTPGGETK
jgi:hypothetical protein